MEHTGNGLVEIDKSLRCKDTPRKENSRLGLIKSFMTSKRATPATLLSNGLSRALFPDLYFKNDLDKLKVSKCQ